MTMRSQFSFDFEPPPPPDPGTNKLLMVVKPDKEEAACVARFGSGLSARLGLRGRLVTPELLHFTLHCLGIFPNVPKTVEDIATVCGDAVRMRPFSVSLNRVMSFRRVRGVPPIVLCGDDGVLGLRILHKSLGDSLRTKTFGRWRSQPFEPHMTLTYEGMAIEEQAIEPINLTIREFALVNSLVGKGRHVPLARWQLGD